MNDDIDRRSSSRARSRAQLFHRVCNYDAKLRLFHNSAIDFSDFGNVAKLPLFSGVLNLGSVF